MDERVEFVQYMLQRGAEMPSARRLSIQEPLDDSGDTDCWTYAYRHALATGAPYVEGICYLSPSRVAAHAWCLEETPFGLQVVEFTLGYESAYDYRGMVVDLTLPEAQRAWNDETTRVSVIELDIMIATAMRGNRHAGIQR